MNQDFIKNEYGIRIENLIYLKKNKGNLIFENLTLAPIDIDLINFKILTSLEKNIFLIITTIFIKRLDSF